MVIRVFWMRFLFPLTYWIVDRLKCSLIRIISHAGGFRISSNSYVNRSGTSPFSNGNNKSLPYVDFSQYFIIKYSYVFLANFFIQQINNSYIYQYVGLGPSIMIFRQSLTFVSFVFLCLFVICLYPLCFCVLQCLVFLVVLCVVSFVFSVPTTIVH